jgi:sigma-B regulation protein RsbU (phosphoserine phosphatase)
VADVSGKGVPAALIVAGIQATVRSLSSTHTSPAALLSTVNETLYRTSSDARYATLLVGFYDERTRTFLYSSAGHHPPLRIRNGRADTLDCRGGFPVGMFEAAQYVEDRAQLDPGDLIALYTDGLIESPNAEGVEFGERRLAELLCTLQDQPLERICESVMDGVSEWSHGLEAHDDATLVLARAR